MAKKFSLGLRNFILGGGSMREAFRNAILEMYSGAQPADADQAVTGTLLCTFTDAGGAHTKEVLASTTITLNSGSSGSIDNITVNGVSILRAAVPYNASLTQTAADVVTALNNNFTDPTYKATSVGAVITLKASPGTGATPNTYAVVVTETTLASTVANGGTLAGGVSAVNGLNFAAAAAGVLSKLASQAWQGTAGASGVAGYFRLKAAILDAGATDSAGDYIRMDGAIATSGAELTMSNTTVVATAVQTLADFDINFPTP